MTEVELDRVLEAMRDIICAGSTETYLPNRDAAYKAWLELQTLNARDKAYH
jgi:hypothetical protein